jgi:hypothetical protein
MGDRVGSVCCIALIFFGLVVIVAKLATRKIGKGDER